MINQKDNLIYKICLTGGPNSGKTTAVASIIEKYGNEFTIYRVPKLNAMNTLAGVRIHKNEYDEETHASLIESKIQAQINLEKYYETIASIQNKPVLLIVNKGTFDHFIDCSESLKDKILNRTGWSYNYLMNNRYDMVIHMLGVRVDSGSNMLPPEVHCEIEKVKRVEEINDLITKVWIGHPNYVLVDNSGINFNAKIQKVMQLISGLIKKPATEYVRKYLLKRPYKVSDLPNYLIYECHQDRITYLVGNDISTINWVVKRTYPHNPISLYLRFNRKLSDRESVYLETCKPIPEKVYYDCIGQNDPKRFVVNKEVIAFYNEKENHTYKYVIENMLVNDDILSLLRIFTAPENKDDPHIPDFLEIGADISDRKDYSTYNLAVNI